MNEERITNSFKSYLEGNLDLKPKLLSGEEIIAEAPKVLMYAPVSKNNKGISGQLTVTNFKLAFVTAPTEDEEDQCCQQNLLLGEYEVCLLAIDHIFQVVDKKRRLLSSQKVPEKIKDIIIVCKNFRVLTFRFNTSDLGKKIASALLHHASPTRHNLLFAYDYKEPYYKSSRGAIRGFNNQLDWERELERVYGARPAWRTSKANEEFQLSPILPRCIVVPSSVVDHQLYEAARYFRSGCPPYWVWGSSNGAALVRMADIQPTITDRVQENVMLENVRKCHPRKAQPVVLDLTKDLPSPRDVYSSYARFRDLCTPDSLRQFWMQDTHFYTLLNSSKWLHAVSSTLQKACKAAELITNETTVVLQEGDGCDMCCVISSLTQILLDSTWRTTTGFQTLLQKEWVALAHPFASRLGHIRTVDGERSPLFLLFLDCVWQLLQQYPCAFEFTETYLTTLWDSAHVSVFDTFLFSCERNREAAVRDLMNPVIPRSVWDWSEQFSEKDIALFMNPLFECNYVEPLQPNYRLPFLEIWCQCYFRWLPSLEITRGGKPQIDLQHRAIVAAINSLQQQLLRGCANDVSETNGIDVVLEVNSFFPFGYNDARSAGLRRNLALNNAMVTADTLTIESQSILNVPD